MDDRCHNKMLQFYPVREITTFHLWHTLQKVQGLFGIRSIKPKKLYGPHARALWTFFKK